MAIILGIDPGSRCTGYGVINGYGQKLEYIDCGVIRVGELPMAERLSQIYATVSDVIERYQPQEMAVEQVFVSQNVDTALKLGQARGVAMVAGSNLGLPLFEYAPRQVKLSVVGNGRADKQQVQHMVRHLLKIRSPLPVDASDALGVAICHHHTQQNMIRLAGARRFKGGRVR